MTKEQADKHKKKARIAPGLSILSSRKAVNQKSMPPFKVGLARL
jgi:hypothetical protein